ncbi:MAG TPA: response regulator [Nitrospirota bacterium]|nr:response regulator [Nitrospirota bacterium]
MVEVSATRSKKKIMVIDDDEIHLEIAKELIEDDVFEVITHHNGFGVLDRVRSLQPDLVLIDINMPGLPGDRLALLLHANDDTRHVPIVFYSSNDENSLREIVSSCDVQGYICKGDLVNLRKRVRQYLEGQLRGAEMRMQ